jgi:hypothetical protein
MKKLLSLITILLLSICGMSQSPVVTTLQPPSSAYCVGNTLILTYSRVGTSAPGWYYQLWVSQNPSCLYSPTCPASVVRYKSWTSNNTDTIKYILPSSYAGNTYQVGVSLGSTPTGQSTQGESPVVGWQITVYGNTTPIPTITGPSSVCIGDQITLTSSSSYQYNWSTGATTQSIVVSPTANTTYSLTVSTPCGTSPMATKFVSVTPPPAASVSPSSNQTICQGGSVLLTASGGSSYLWSTGAGSQSISVSTSGQYYCIASNSCGSDTSNIVTVTVLPAPVVNLTSSNSPICIGDSAVLSASGALSYVWSTGQSTSQITVYPTSNTTYTVTATDGNGCTGTNSIGVQVTQLPVANAGPDVTIQIGDSTIVGGASSGTSYLWNTGATTQQITVTPTVTTTYTLIVSNQCGSDTDMVTVTVTQATGIANHLSNNDVSLYPNPARLTLNIVFAEAPLNSTLRVYDISGKVVIEQVVKSFSEAIDVSSLRPGVYSLSVTGGGIYLNEKFIKE